MIDRKITPQKMLAEYTALIDSLRPVLVNNSYDDRSIYAALSVLTEGYRELIRQETTNKTEFDNIVSTLDIMIKGIVSKGLRPLLDDANK